MPVSPVTAPSHGQTDTASDARVPPRDRTVLVRLCAAGLVAYCSYSICRAPLLPLYASELGASASLIGFVMGASTLTGVVLKLPAGALSDLFGRRRLLLGGALVFATLPFTYLFVSTVAALIALRFLHGSATAIFGPVAAASLSDVAPKDSRGAWLSTYSTAQGAGQAIGPVLAGYLIAAGRFDLAFVFSGIIGLAVPLIVARGRTAPPVVSGRSPWREFQRGVLEVSGDRLILIISAAHAAQFVLNGMLNAFLPLYGRDVLQLSTAELGWLFGVQTVTTLVVRPFIGRMSDRVGRRSIIATGLSLSSLTVFSLPLVAGLQSVLAIVVIYAAGIAITTAATSACITDITRRARYGAAHGVFGTIYDIGDALGPISAGVLVSMIGYARMFQVMAGLGVAMALLFVITTRSYRARVARTPGTEME